MIILHLPPVILAVNDGERRAGLVLSGEQVSDGVYRVCLEVLGFEFEFHKFTSFSFLSYQIASFVKKV